MSKKKIPTSLQIVERYFKENEIIDEYSEISLPIHRRGEIVPIAGSLSIFPTPVVGLICEYAFILNYLPTDVRSYRVSLLRVRLDIIENMDCEENIEEIMGALFNHWGFKDENTFYPIDGTILLAGNMKDILFRTFNFPTSTMYKELCSFIPDRDGDAFEMNVQHNEKWQDRSSRYLFRTHFVHIEGTHSVWDWGKICSGVVRNCDIYSSIHWGMPSVCTITSILRYKDLDFFKKCIDEVPSKYSSHLRAACDMCLQDQKKLTDRGIIVPNGALTHLIRSGVLSWCIKHYKPTSLKFDIQSSSVLEKHIRAMESSWPEFKMKTKCKFPIPIGTIDGEGTYTYPGGGTQSCLSIYHWIYERFAYKITDQVIPTLHCPHWGEEAFCGIAFPCPSHPQ